MALSKMQREYLEHLVVCEETGMSDKEWCTLMGVSPTAAKGWRDGSKCPEFPSLLEAAKKEYAESHSVLGAKTFVWALEEAYTNYRKAKSSGDHAEARKWWKEITAISKPVDGKAVVDYSEWTDEDLFAEVMTRGLSDTDRALNKLSGVTR